jgi:hypothetical protein
MATKKTKSMSKGRANVNKLKVGREKSRELTDKEVKRIRGGTAPASPTLARIKYS